MRKTKRSIEPCELQNIPGVGPNLAQDLIDLGYRRIPPLRGANPERMYEKLCTLRGTHIDRCVLYVFRCVVYYANNTEHDPALLKWWSWKDVKPNGTYQSRRVGVM